MQIKPPRFFHPSIQILSFIILYMSRGWGFTCDKWSVHQRRRARCTHSYLWTGFPAPGGNMHTWRGYADSSSHWGLQKTSWNDQGSLHVRQIQPEFFMHNPEYMLRAPEWNIAPKEWRSVFQVLLYETFIQDFSGGARQPTNNAPGRIHHTTTFSVCIFKVAGA